MSKATPVSAPLGPNDRLIVALDGVNPAQAKELVGQLSKAVRFFKVGTELFFHQDGGWRLVDELARDFDAELFLDLKLNDIPATVSSTIQQIEHHPGVVFATVHFVDDGLEAALRARQGKSPLIFAVTLLTSHSEPYLKELGVQITVEDYVLRMARLANAMHCDGVIASGREVAAIKAEMPKLFVITPGIRPAWASVQNDDQKRVVTPTEAIQNGADFIVVGRPVRTYLNASGELAPLEAATRVQREISEALHKRDEIETKRHQETDASVRSVSVSVG